MPYVPSGRARAPIGKQNSITSCSPPQSKPCSDDQEDGERQEERWKEEDGWLAYVDTVDMR